jgi:RimJ/RimL family protein N-acetyltransferase
MTRHSRCLRTAGLPNAVWAVEEKQRGAFIGRIGILAHDDWTATEHNIEVGWLIGREWWGGGRASLEYGFTTLQLPHIISITVPENTASRLVME